jgi:hypothetical protein
MRILRASSLQLSGWQVLRAIVPQLLRRRCIRWFDLYYSYQGRQIQTMKKLSSDYDCDRARWMQALVWIGLTLLVLPAAILEGFRGGAPQPVAATIGLVAMLGVLWLAWRTRLNYMHAVWLDGDHLLLVDRSANYRIGIGEVTGVSRPYASRRALFMNPDIVRIKVRKRSGRSRNFYFVPDSYANFVTLYQWSRGIETHDDKGKRKEK